MTFNNKNNQIDKIKIVGDNYSGSFIKTRTACRVIIIDNNMILTSYEENTGQYMIPGGGKEENESDCECAIRELKEKTGFVVKPSECVLEVDEYYGNIKYVSNYFFGTIVGQTKTHLTEVEKEVDMVPKWVNIDEIIDIFSSYKKYDENNEMRSGLYLRELTALKKIFNK